MKSLGLIGTACLCAVAAATPAAAQSAGAVSAGAVSAGADRAAHRQALARRIDELLLAKMREAGVTPAPLASDAEFLRRASLDLTGVIPRAAAARAFLASATSDNAPSLAERRARLVDELLASPRHATHLANLWRQLLLPGGLNLEEINSAVGVQNWLRQRFQENLRYDNLVSELLIATEGNEAGPALFYTSLDLAPEKLAASTARIFLGLQLECAQCHDHPFDQWKQRDFWGYAAFFARLSRTTPDGRMTERIVDRPEGEVMLPQSSEVIPPRHLRGAAAEDGSGSRRLQLAIWMASRDNPYLARAAVNRVWAILFGRGLVEPVDDLGPNNPPSHPELLAELASDFARTGFDLRELFRTLASTQAYQRTSQWPGEPPPAELFACMAIKPLSAEQLYDSLLRTVGRRDASAAPLAASPLLEPQRQAFLARMPAPGRSAAEFQAGVLQALTLLNGGDVAEATDPERGALVGALDAPLFTDAERIEALWLATLARPPAEEERSAAAAHLQARSASDRRRALADLLWAILNGAEFCLNH